MRILSRSTLAAFWRSHADAEHALRAWIREVDHARWTSTAEIRKSFNAASFIGDKVVFNIGGNKYRLIVRTSYAVPSAQPPLNGLIRIIMILTHSAYDDIDITKL
ncbi:MAG: type II toxin-antitoxin system HigB family toxin [Polyangiales bacterium]